jgi:hypothetical protein
MSRFPPLELVMVVTKRSSRPNFNKIYPLMEPLGILRISCHLHPLWVGEIVFCDPTKALELIKLRDEFGSNLRCNLFRGCFLQDCEGFGNPKTGLCSLCKHSRFDNHVPILDTALSIRLINVMLPDKKVLFLTMTISLWQPKLYTVGIVPVDESWM